MKTLPGRCSVWILLVLAMMGTTFASGPIVVYALVDRVVFEPNESAPTQIQIWGTFALAASRFSSTYSDPQKGYLYYKIDSTNPQATRTVWADLKKVAGTAEVVGFGGSYFSNEDAGRVRKASEKLKDPDPFPFGNPVTYLGAAQSVIVSRLKAVSQGK